MNKNEAESKVKRKPGRPRSYEEAKVNYTHRMTSKAHQWIKDNRLKIEELARQ